MQVKNPRGVQQADVSAAADALLAERLRPTIERVRQKLGRGSPNTVAPMLETWFSTLGLRMGFLGIEPAEGGMPEPVRLAMNSMWEATLSEAKRRTDEAVAEERAAMSAERDAVNSDRTELQAKAAALELREKAAEDVIVDMRSQLADATQRAAQSQEMVATKDHELAQLRKNLADQVQMVAEERLRQEKLRAAHASELEKLQVRSTATEKRMLNDVDRSRQESKALKAELVSLGNKFRAERATLEQVNAAAIQNQHVLALEMSVVREKLAASEKHAADFERLLKLKIRPPTGSRKTAKLGTLPIVRIPVNPAG